MVRWILSAIKQFAITELWEESRGLWALLGVKYCATSVQDVSRSNSLLNQETVLFLQAFYPHGRFPHNPCLLWDTKAACFAAQKTLTWFLNYHARNITSLLFFVSTHNPHSNSKLSPRHPLNASLSHCSSALHLAGVHAPRGTCLPVLSCSKTCQEHRSQRQWGPATHWLGPTTCLALGRLPVWLGMPGASLRLQSWLCCAC